METLTLTPAEGVEEETISVPSKIVETLTVTPAEGEEVIIVEKNRYAAGKIYRMICTDGHFYIGSTINTLNFRFSNHKRSAKQGNTSPCYLYFNTIGWEHVTMELVENYSCKSNKELIRKEDEYIQKAKKDPLCLNFKRAHVAVEERPEYIKTYLEKNRDNILTYKKEYREKNAEAIADYNKKYVAEHVEEVKERKDKYYEGKKNEILAVNRLYVQSHKEAVNTYKKKWAKENYAKLAPAKKAAHDAKTAARVLRDKTSVSCICGGTYLPHHKNRHAESKKHLKFATA